MPTQTDTSPKKAIVWLESVYEFRDRDVSPFLLKNPDLLPIVEKIAEMVPRYFGARVELALETLRDPEGEPEPGLFAVIRSPPAAEAELDHQRAFDEGWWFAQVPKVAGRLTVTLE